MLRPLEPNEQLQYGDQVYYGYIHCSNKHTCFTKYKEATVVEPVGKNWKYRILVKGNKNSSIRLGTQLFIKVKPTNE